MRAAVFHKPKDVRIENVPDPRVEHGRDAIIRVSSTAICGSDLHIYNGFLPQFTRTVLGHEFMGVIEELGADVKNLRRGDRVVVPFPVACGQCWFCRHQEVTSCERSNPQNYGPEGGMFKEKGGAIFGYTDLYGGYAGGQAEWTRVPYADFGPRKIPDLLTDEQALFLTDILPTAWSALDWAQLKGGETVAVLGCGPVGLMAQKCAWLFGAERVIGIDIREYRLDMAEKAAHAETINSAKEDPVEAIRARTEGRGADLCIDAVGMEADRTVLEKMSGAIHWQKGSDKALLTAISAVRRGGAVSVVGSYGTAFDHFPLGQIFDKGIRLRFGKAQVHRHIDKLLALIEDRKIKTDDIITHRMPLEQAPFGYEIFNRKQDDCVKVVLHP